MDAAVLSLPIPLVTALLALALAARVASRKAVPRQARWCFSALFVALALQAALVGLRFGYGADFVAPVQRILPFAAGPLVYLGFRALTAGRIAGLFARHGLVAAGLAVVCSGLLVLVNVPDPPPALAVFGNIAVDALIAMSFAVYVVLLVRLYRRGPDVFESADFASAETTRRWLLGAIVFLSAIALVDIVIALDFLLYGGRQVGVLIGLVSLAVVVALAFGIVADAGRSSGSRIRRAGAASPEDEAIRSADQELLEALRAVLADRQLYRDPDLTLARLGRRLGIPARSVSEAVNRQLGINVSQFVNGFRVEHAAGLLATTQRPVADIMIESGFRTKSNFNREFRRVFAASPAEYRQRSGRSAPAITA